MRRAWQIASQSPHLPIVAYLVFVGVVALTRGTSASPLDDQVPGWLLLMWSLTLAAGGVIAIFGTVVERSRVESSGLAFCLSGMFLYFIAYQHGAPAVVALGLMCASRLWVLHRARKTITEAVKIVSGGDQ